MVVGSASSRTALVEIIGRMGYQCGEADDPYSAMAEICQRPLAYRALILSLSGLFPEELELIAAVKRRYAHMEIWLGHTDGRPGALADALRLGADGLLADDGVHRFSSSPKDSQPVVAEESNPAAEDVATANRASANVSMPVDCVDYRREPTFLDGPTDGEPILTADELRALLEDPPTPPSRSLSNQEDRHP
ncbi:MAG TPA: hypothetical protein VHP11_06640 [Tepidisphaeraceae bacterium]|nr:hypothetical protein [Tepidisphaeraceae bacterium]